MVIVIYMNTYNIYLIETNRKVNNTFDGYVDSEKTTTRIQQVTANDAHEALTIAGFAKSPKHLALVD